jgi:hypothetical protein
VALSADVAHRHDGRAQVETKILPHPDLRLSERLPCPGDLSGRDREERAVAAEDKGYATVAQRVQYGRDHAHTRHIDSLVFTTLDGARRTDDIRGRERPVGGQGPIVPLIGDA